MEVIKVAPSSGIRSLSAICCNLVEYKGGGYDGCFWEGNWAWVSRTGVFHNIMSSGRRGCETAEALLEHLQQSGEPNRMGEREWELFPLRAGCITETRAAWERFQATSPVRGVLLSGFWLWEHEPKLRRYLRVQCSKCRHWLPVTQTHAAAYRGEGGTSYLPSEIHCSDCGDASDE